MGIAPLVKGNRKKEGLSDLHRSAVGYLIQQGEAADADGLQQHLRALSSDALAIGVAGEINDRTWQPLSLSLPPLSSRQMTRSLRDDWRVTSYSGLQQHGHNAGFELLPRLDVDAAGEAQGHQAVQLTPYNFPRGAAPGTFLHALFENIDFTQPVDPQWLSAQLTRQGYDAAWLPVMLTWIERVLQTPLNDSGASLHQLPPACYQVELQFFLPVGRLLRAQALDQLVKRYDPLSAGCPPLSFQQVQGMLKGFIDLVFRWQGKYYLLDYKSNWLGDAAADYTQEAMAQAMRSHRYDLQYQLYTLALHRYLRHRLPDYDYQQHFGGVIYLFLRGVDGECRENGVWFNRPDAALISGMDALFIGENEEDL